MKLTRSQRLIEQDTGFTQEQAEQLALIFLDKPEGDSEERTIKALELLERMLFTAQSDITLIGLLLGGEIIFNLSEDQTELLFGITNKGLDAVEIMGLLDDTKDGPVQ